MTTTSLPEVTLVSKSQVPTLPAVSALVKTQNLSCTTLMPLVPEAMVMLDCPLTVLLALEVAVTVRDSPPVQALPLVGLKVVWVRVEPVRAPQPALSDQSTP